MSSRNGFSLRQLCAGAGCGLLLPIALLLSREDWLWIALGSGAAVLYIYILYRRGGPSDLQKAAETAWGRAAKPFLLLHGISMLVLTAELSAQVGSIFPDTAGLRWVGLGVLALAGTAAYLGSAVTLRCGAVLFVPLAVILGLVPLLALPGAKAEWLIPTGKPLGGAAALVLFLLPGALGYLQPELREKNAAPPRWMLGLSIAAPLTAAFTGARLSPVLAQEPLSYFRLARSASVFGVMLRLESFVSGALTASAFTGMALLLCAAKKALEAAEKNLGAKYLSGVPLLGALAAGLSLLPAGILDRIAPVTAIFCALFPVLTQAVAARKKPEKIWIFCKKSVDKSDRFC